MKKTIHPPLNQKFDRFGHGTWQGNVMLLMNRNAPHLPTIEHRSVLYKFVWWKLWTLYFVYTPHILIAIWKKWKIHDSASVYQIIKLLHVWKYSQFIAGQYNSRYLGHVRVYTHIHRYKIHDFWLEYKGQKAKTCIRLSHVWWFIITPQTTLNLVYVSYAPHFLPWKANRRKIQYVRLYVLIVDQRTAKNPRNSIQIEQICTPCFLFVL